MRSSKTWSMSERPVDAQMFNWQSGTQNSTLGSCLHLYDCNANPQCALHGAAIDHGQGSQRTNRRENANNISSSSREPWMGECNMLTQCEQQGHHGVTLFDGHARCRHTENQFYLFYFFVFKDMHNQKSVNNPVSKVPPNRGDLTLPAKPHQGTSPSTPATAYRREDLVTSEVANDLAHEIANMRVHWRLHAPKRNVVDSGVRLARAVNEMSTALSSWKIGRLDVSTSTTLAARMSTNFVTRTDAPASRHSGSGAEALVRNLPE